MVIVLLGRLLWVDLMKWVSDVRPPVRPSTKRFFDFNKIVHVGRGRRVMHEDMQYDPDPRSTSRGLESRKFAHFQRLSPPPFIIGAGKWPRILKLGRNTQSLSGPDFLFLSNFLCHVTLKLAVSRSRPSVPYGANLFLVSSEGLIVWFWSRHTASICLHASGVFCTTLNDIPIKHSIEWLYYSSR